MEDEKVNHIVKKNYCMEEFKKKEIALFETQKELKQKIKENIILKLISLGLLIFLIYTLVILGNLIIELRK